MRHRICTRSLFHDIHLRRWASVNGVYQASSPQFCAHTWPFRHVPTGENETHIIHLISKSVTQVRRDLNSLSHTHTGVGATLQPPSASEEMGTNAHLCMEWHAWHGGGLSQARCCALHSWTPWQRHRAEEFQPFTFAHQNTR